MKNSEIYKVVFEKIKSSKLNAEILSEKCLQEALNIKEFKEIYIKYKSKMLEIYKKEYSNEDTTIDKNELEKINNQLNLIAKKHNIKIENFKPKYNCKKCEDTGIINDNYCECFYNILNNEIIKNLGITVDTSHTFENANFSIFDKPKDTEKIYKKFENWCEQIPNSNYKTGLILGNTGVGKTYLLDCIVNKLLKKNLIINYYSAFALSELFLKYRTLFEEKKSGLLDGVLGCDVLIIDDLGAEPNFKNNEEYFYLLFNERLNKNIFTIISSNLMLNELKQRYGERSFSRFIDKSHSFAIKLENSDLRLKKDK